MNVNEKIRFLKKNAKLNGEEIGKALGYTPQAISKGVAECKRLHFMLNVLIDEQQSSNLTGKHFIKFINDYST